MNSNWWLQNITRIHVSRDQRSRPDVLLNLSSTPPRSLGLHNAAIARQWVSWYPALYPFLQTNTICNNQSVLVERTCRAAYSGCVRRVALLLNKSRLLHLLCVDFYLEHSIVTRGTYTHLFDHTILEQQNHLQIERDWMLEIERRCRHQWCTIFVYSVTSMMTTESMYLLSVVNTLRSRVILASKHFCNNPGILGLFFF